MSARPNSDLLIAAWLDEEARNGAPERLVEATRRHLEGTNQRRVVGPAWRPTPMNVRIAVVAAALVVAVAGAYLILPRSTGPGALSTPSPSPAGIPADGTYESEPIDVSEIRNLLSADAALTDSERASIEDGVLGIREATTFQSAIEIRGGSAFIAGQRTDQDDFAFEIPWALRRIDSNSFAVATTCCGQQIYDIEYTSDGFRLTAVSLATSPVETFARHVTFELSPFTRVP